jgi:hypothetical protein
MGLLRGKKRSGKKGKRRGKASSSSDYSRVNSGASSVNGGAVSDGDSDSDDDDSDSGDGKSKAATLLTKIAEQKEVTRSYYSLIVFSTTLYIEYSSPIMLTMCADGV